MKNLLKNRDMNRKKNLQYVIKRTGEKELFDENKIYLAVKKAFIACKISEEEGIQNIVRQSTSFLSILSRHGHYPTVENIQDLVEKLLMDNGYSAVAKAYILYRDFHSKLREPKELLAGATKLVDDYIQKEDWRINENSNMSYSLQGLNNHIASVITAKYWLNAIYPNEIRQAHLKGQFHIHDLGMLSVYCCGWDLQDLLTRGFGGAYGKISAHPPRHFRTALGQIVNFFYTLQGEAAGAQAFSSFDTLLAPFLYYDNLSYKEVKQGIQEFVYNMNVPTRVGFQTPFTNITMDLQVPSILANQPVILGGEQKDKCYGDFQKEMNMINRAFCEIMMEGDARGRIFTFPIPTYNITKDFDWNNEELEPLWIMTGKYGIPYFANFVNSDMNPEDARSMCCRLRLDNRELRRRGGGLFGANPLTGSIGVITINMPRIGFQAQSEEEFLAILKNLMILAKDSLEIKRVILEKFTDQGLYPYSKYYLKNMKKRSGAYWKSHFSTIGLIGMNEACLNFLGKSIFTSEGHDFSLRILDAMRDIILQFQEETGHLYNLEATPAEGTSYRLASLDQQYASGIIQSGTESTPFYTNSTQLPVDATDDLWLALRHQDALQSSYTGGTVFHTLLGERISDINMVKTLLKKMTGQFTMPYISLTPTFTICPEHGYIPGEHFSCPYNQENEVAGVQS